MKEINGTVVSNQVNNTVLVMVESKTPHKKYHKVISKTKRYQVNVVGRETSLGDKVRIAPMRPISKNKCWKLLSD